MRRDYRRGRLSAHRKSSVSYSSSSFNSNYNRENSYNNGSYGDNSYYNSSSVAYDYETEREYYEPRRKQSIERRKKAKRNKIKIVNEATVHSAKIYVPLVIIFAFAVSVVMSNARVIEQKATIAQLKDELKQVQEDNNNIETELTKNINMEEVEKQASQRLGMQKPASYQIVYIDVPKQSYTSKFENNSDKIKTGKLEELKESLKKLFRRD